MSVGGKPPYSVGVVGPDAQECPALWEAVSPRGPLCFQEAAAQNSHSGRTPACVSLP